MYERSQGPEDRMGCLGFLFLPAGHCMTVLGTREKTWSPGNSLRQRAGDMRRPP